MNSAVPRGAMKSLGLRNDAHEDHVRVRQPAWLPAMHTRKYLQASRLFLLLDVTQDEGELRLFFFRVTKLAINIVRISVKILPMVQKLLVEKHTIIYRRTR
jgi:hypothetical protein